MMDIRVGSYQGSDMTRQILTQFIAQVGTVDASILLEHWRDGLDEIPESVEKWLAGSNGCTTHHSD